MIFTIFDGKVVKKGSKQAILYNFRPKSNNRPSKKNRRSHHRLRRSCTCRFRDAGAPCAPYFAASIILCFRVQSLSERST